LLGISGTFRGRKVKAQYMFSLCCILLEYPIDAAGSGLIAGVHSLELCIKLKSFLLDFKFIKAGFAMVRKQPPFIQGKRLFSNASASY